jgi:hypothetical protein
VLIDSRKNSLRIKLIENDSHLIPPINRLPLMSVTSETVLSAVSASETERLLVVLISSPDHSSRMELRQQSFSPGIGWFTQSTVRLEPGQVAGLRNALGATSTHRSSNRLPREFSTIAPQTWQPRVVHADSA